MTPAIAVIGVLWVLGSYLTGIAVGTRIATALTYGGGAK